MKSYVLIFFIFLTITTGCQTTRYSKNASEYASDAKITSVIKYKIATSQNLANLHLHVDTYKGNVLVSGFINNSQQKEEIKNIVHSVSGVKKLVI